MTCIDCSRMKKEIEALRKLVVKYRRERDDARATCDAMIERKREKAIAEKDGKE